MTLQRKTPFKTRTKPMPRKAKPKRQTAAVGLMYGKAVPVRSQALRDSAEGEACVRCGVSDGTVVMAHYTGLRQHAYGKGRGIKGHDYISALLCLSCHQYFDQPQQRKSIEASEEFHHLVAMTWRGWIERGLIVIRGA